MTRAQARRSGFTLIELLVVIGLMLLLFGLGVAFLPSASSTAAEARAASMVQSWLNIARQRAQRDQVPHGVRFLVKSLGGLSQVVTDAQYIEQPEDYAIGFVYIPDPS